MEITDLIEAYVQKNIFGILMVCVSKNPKENSMIIKEVLHSDTWLHPFSDMDVYKKKEIPFAKYKILNENFQMNKKQLEKLIEKIRNDIDIIEEEKQMLIDSAKRENSLIGNLQFNTYLSN